MFALSNARLSVEWPTLALIAGNLCLFAGLTAAWSVLPAWAVLPALVVVLTLHASLQHEAIHGHPTRHAGLNAALVGLPLSLWLPYGIYRREHLRHHATERLADPRLDPESMRPDPATGAWRERLFATLAGRLVLGPPLAALATWRQGLGEVASGDREARAIWLRHLLLSALTLAWLVANGVPVWLYLLAAVWPAAALTHLRAYFEHRPAPDNARASVIVERPGLFGLLFLNNNLHALHHARPDLPWYLLPARYRADRKQILASNGDFRLPRYGPAIRAQLFRPLASQL